MQQIEPTRPTSKNPPDTWLDHITDADYDGR
jgi:hypothetical protein